ncbi:MAG TPA: sugar nucleotide-binding protein [Planctomycetaceae bacterium]|nr:sugar nucleotide-binding protein [Planctomycetaceae bacterium]
MFVILGGSGYVGTAFQKQLQGLSLPFEVVTRSTVDYSNEATLVRFLTERRPEFLINAAGYTGRPNVDACEVHRTECLQGNAVLPGIVRSACEKMGVPWGHVSSGCVYTGTQPDGSGFRETDPPNFSFRQDNCSFYSGCKALGEEILADAENCFIWRLRIPFNEVDGPRNYISKMMRYDCLLKATNSLSQLDEFAAACIACWTRRVPFGVYNLTNPGSVTTEDVVRLIKKHGLTQKAFRFFESEDQFMQQAAKTPRSNCVLDTARAESLALPMTPVMDALETAMRRWNA